MYLTVGELKRKLENLPDGMKVVVIGHFGEGIRVMDSICEPQGSCQVVDSHWDSHDDKELEDVFVIPHTEIGDDPY